MQCGCACRGNAGWAHVACIVRSALHAGHGEGCGCNGWQDPCVYSKAWHECPTCLQRYTGGMEAGLQLEAWRHFKDRPADDESRQVVQYNLARVLYRAGRFEEAKALLDELLTALRQRGRENTSAALQIMGTLGVVLVDLGQHTEAEHVARKVLLVLRRTKGHGHEDTLRASVNLAWIFWRQKKHSQAEGMCRRTAAEQATLLGADHVHTLDTRACLAQILWSQQKDVEAEATARDNL